MHLRRVLDLRPKWGGWLLHPGEAMRDPITPNPLLQWQSLN